MTGDDKVSRHIQQHERMMARRLTRVFETKETHKDLEDSGDDTISVTKPSPAKTVRPKTAKQVVRLSEASVGDTIDTMYAQRKSFADGRLLIINKNSKETELNEMHVNEVLDKKKTYFSSLKLHLQPPLT
jgi:hypothetical protein